MTTLTIYRNILFDSTKNTAKLQHKHHLCSMKISTIYKIQSKIKSERCYIGSAMDINRRWESHHRMLRNNKHHSVKLQNHFNKYGMDDLVFSILEPCFPEFLTTREQHYIDTLKPYFNICKTAGSTLGFKQSVEFCKNRSEIMKGNKIFLGLKHSKETILQMSDSHIGQIPWNKGNHECWTKERLQKMSDFMKANNPMRGKHHTEESCKAISASAMGNKRWLGKKHKEETLIKMKAPKSAEHKQHLKDAWVIRKLNKVVA